MAQLSFVIVPAKALKDGRHKIRIAVAHNSETRYIVTDVIIDSERQFRNGQVTHRPDANMLNAKLRKVMSKYMDRLYSLEYTEGLTCSELVAELKDDMRSKDVTVAEAFDMMMLYTTTRESTQVSTRGRYRAFIKFVSPKTPVRKLSRLTLMGFEKHLRAKKLSMATVSNYINFVCMLVTFSRRIGLVDASFNPFDGYKKPQTPVRDCWLTTEEIRTIRDCPVQSKAEQRARDLFMLSYYLGGINMVDLLSIDFNVCRKELRYSRSKVRDRCGTEVRYTMPDEAVSIIKRVVGPDGRIHGKKRNDRFVTYHMKTIRERLNIPNLIFYSARKSFSQHAFELGISTQVIDYILGHSMRSHGVIYHYVSVKPEMATEAIRKVIDNLNGKEEA